MKYLYEKAKNIKECTINKIFDPPPSGEVPNSPPSGSVLILRPLPGRPFSLKRIKGIRLIKNVRPLCCCRESTIHCRVAKVWTAKHTERHFLILMMDAKLKSNGLFYFFGIIRVYQNGVMMSFTLYTPLHRGYLPL